MAWAEGVVSRERLETSYLLVGTTGKGVGIEEVSGEGGGKGVTVYLAGTATLERILPFREWLRRSFRQKSEALEPFELGQTAVSDHESSVEKHSAAEESISTRALRPNAQRRLLLRLGRAVG